MPGDVARTVSVFISYRREGGFYLAKNIYDHLKANKYDVFMDLHSLGAGEFESKTLAEIAARDYFVIVLTIGSMDRMLNDGDWLRRELTAALKADRTIVPVLDVRFDFATDDIKRTIAALPVDLRKLTSFNAVRMPPFEYFEDAMARLCRFLTPRPGAQVIRSKPAELVRAESVLKHYDAFAPTALTGTERKTLSWSDLQGKLFRTKPQLAAPKLSAALIGVHWTEVPGATEYVLERSAERSFASSTVAYSGPGTSYMDFARTVIARTTFYRVKAIGARAVSRDSEWSGVYEQKPPVVPRLNAPVLSGGFGRCTWTEVKGATKYVLERSTRRDFTLSAVAYEGTKTSYVDFSGYISKHGSSTFYRVKAVGAPLESRDSEWSNIYKEEQSAAAALRLSAPVLTADKFGGLRWTEVKTAAKYVLEQSGSQDFASSTVAYQGANTFYIDFVKFSKLGRTRSSTYYRVKAIGSVPPWSDSAWSNVVSLNE